MNLLAIFTALCLSLSSCSTSAAAKRPDAPAPVILLTFRADVTSSSANGFKQAMTKILEKKPKAILVVIDSPGGSVEAGFEIQKAISKSPVPVHCIVDGKAQSMAFVFLQACATRGMTLTSQLMAHQPHLTMQRIGGDGTIQFTISELKSMELDLATDAERMALFSSQRMKMSLADFQAKVEGIDWAMGAATAVKNNAADYISTVAQARKKLEAGKSPSDP